MDITEAIQKFLEACELDNCASKTIKNYRERLGYFSSWLSSTHGVVDIEKVELGHLRGWMTYLKKTPSAKGKSLSDSTVYTYGRTLLVFFHWLEQEEVIDRPISKRFKLPRVEKKFIPTYTSDDIKRLLDACEEGDPYKPHLSKALTIRNRAIVSLFVDTGIRLSELVGLRLCDIDRRLHIILVHRKGNKWQQVPVSRDGFKPLHEYLTRYRHVLARTDVAYREDPVFLSNNGEPLTVWGVSMLFRRLKRRTEIEGKRVSPHNCRRYMATTQLQMGRSPLDVQRQMGHTTLAMTNDYASLSVEHLKRSHEMYSPLRADENSPGEGSDDGYWNS